MEETSVDHLLEQVVLESLGNYLYLSKLNDKIGLVTQWGAPSWLVLQRLKNKGTQTAAELASARHVTDAYMHSLLRPLQQATLISAEGNGFALTDSGHQALAKLEQVFETSLRGYANDFRADELATTLKVLSQLREHIADDRSF